MKKVNLFLVKAFALVLFMGLNASAFAQNPIPSEVWDISSAGQQYTQKIVAENQTTTIAFSQDGFLPHEYLFYRTSTLTGTSLTDVAKLLDKDFIIKDMQVFNGRIYFCGEHQGQGFIAWANITVLFTSPTGTFQYYIIKNSQSIDKIEVYNNNSGMQIACIGVDVNNQSFFLHLDYGTLNYEMFYSNYPNEIIDDLEINSQYVVTVGHAPSLFSGFDLVITRYDINVITTNNQLALNFPNDKLLYKLHAKTVFNENLAVVGTTDYNGASTLMCVFDVINPSIIKTEWMDGYGNQTIDIRDLAYYPSTKELIILELANTSQSTIPQDAAIVWDVVNPSPITVNIYYGLQNGNPLLLNGICEYMPHHFAAIGIDTSNMNTVSIWYGEVLINVPTSSCNIPVIEQTLSAIKQPSQTYNVVLKIKDVVNWKQSTTQWYNYPVTPVCY